MIIEKKKIKKYLNARGYLRLLRCYPWSFDDIKDERKPMSVELSAKQARELADSEAALKIKVDHDRGIIYIYIINGNGAYIEQ